MTTVDPSWDPQTKARVRAATDRLFYEMQDTLMRRTGRDGRFAPPGDIAEFGDVTGLLKVIEHQVLGPMQSALDKLRAEMLAVWAQVDEHKRGTIGPNYRPPPRDM